jgi:Na+/H+ antiporter
MEVFEVVIALLLAGAALAALARRVGAPYPALVALAGAALALIPGTPTLVLDPELALALFVAPVLVDAAFDSSPRDLRANWRVISGLALGAVALTIVVVALVAHALVPGMPWPVAIALGAIVAPPDAAAATTVLKQLRPPNRLLVILEGESLFNDASALLVYRLAVGATVAAFSGWSVLPMLLVVTVGSIVLALVLSRLSLFVIARIRDVATAVVFQFCGTFFVWILAEQLHLSGIITTVVYAMAASRHASEIVPARIRIPSWAVWEVAVFVLNVLAFILVGFQLKSIAARATSATGAQYAAVAAAVLVAVILARIAWVTGAAAFSRWRCRPRADGLPGPRDAVALTPRAAAVVGWCGMRGTVTLAAALALPTDYPYRDLILATAFGVTLGTLVLQGLTLRPLMLRLRLVDDGSVDREVRLARVETLRAALTAIATCPGAEAAELVHRRYELQLRGAEAGFAGEVADTKGQDDDAAVVRAATEAQRRRLMALRFDGTIGDTAFQRIEEELDWTEMGWAQVVGSDQAANAEPRSPAAVSA